MSKVVNENGEVAVLYSPGHGAGWYSWNPDPSLLFDARLVNALLRGAGKSEIISIAKEIYPKGYFGGAEDLEIEWIKEGTKFRIDEYDGSETVVTIEETSWITA